MTKAELIAMLAEVPDDAVVVVDGYEEGFDDPVLTYGWAVLGVSSHEDVTGADRRSHHASVVVLSRYKPSEGEPVDEARRAVLAGASAQRRTG